MRPETAVGRRCQFRHRPSGVRSPDLLPPAESQALSEARYGHAELRLSPCGILLGLRRLLLRVEALERDREQHHDAECPEQVAIGYRAYWRTCCEDGEAAQQLRNDEVPAASFPHHRQRRCGPPERPCTTSFWDLVLM